MSSVRNRIKAHRRVRAGDLVPHEWSCRLHPASERAALHALDEAVGFARGLLAYELPDDRWKRIDGHLRRDLDPDREVDVEILDMTAAEARALLLSIDPLAALAETREQLHRRLRELAPPVPEDLQVAWEATARASLARVDDSPASEAAAGPEEFFVLVKCREERQQGEVLQRLQGEGPECKALMS